LLWTVDETLMQKEHLYQPFEIIYKTLDECPKLDHQHTFFELVYVLQGKGKQCINGSSFSYRDNHMFLLTPGDCHRFDIEETTTFLFLRFTDIYLSESGLSLKYVQQLEYILQNASHRPGCILKNKADKPLIASLVASILQEQNNRQLYFNKVTEQIVNTVITVVARNIALKLPKNIKENTGEAVLEILHYIQENIFEPQMLRAERLSKQFSISLSYLGRYFKKQTGETLQHYISNYKLRLVEARLLHSDMTVNEIAYEFNFTDESHLNRAFKKHKGMSPTAYRKLYQAEN